MQLENLSRLPDQLITLLTDPSSNLPAAFMLYGILGGMLLIVLLAAIMFLMGSEEDAHEEDMHEQEYAETGPAEEAESERAVETTAAKPGPAPRPKDRKRTLLTLGVWVAIAAAVFVAAGVTTSSSSVCFSCHADNPHVSSQAVQNPHKSVACVDCHEPGGALGHYSTGVVARAVHYLDAWTDIEAPGDYGMPTSASCSACHEASLKGVTLNKQRGLKMSHTEPLAASASCLDCHQPKDGVVGTHNAGMNPCLRCHDSKKASSECSTCHDSKAAVAARARTTEFAKVQVPEVKCGGCHDEKRECDSCHGMRLPHTREFMTYAHARAGAVDFWYNDGKTCSRCHTATRRPCTKCHSQFLGRGHSKDLANSHRGANEVSCNTCHHTLAYLPNRNFCTDVCHNQAAIAGSPR